jgi:prepilin-type N-terminal cleavage/methylation domain-containing protein
MTRQLPASPSPRGFSLVEIIVALTILTGSLLGFAMVAQRFTRSNTDVATRTLASDLATSRLEQIKGFRNYTTLVTTYNNQVETWTGTNAYAGFTRTTYVTRIGPNANDDYTTITVVVTGRALAPAVRRTTSIAAF